MDAKPISEQKMGERDLPEAESPDAPRGRALLVFSILLAILAAFDVFEAIYLVVNGNIVAEQLAAEDLANTATAGTVDETVDYFDPRDTSLVDDYRAYGVAMVVVTLTEGVVQVLACWQGVGSWRRRSPGAACETLGIGLIGLACIVLSLNVLAIGPEPLVFVDAIVSVLIALGYFVSARHLARSDFWEGIKDETDTALEAARWVGEIEDRAARLPREFRLDADYMLEPVHGSTDDGSTQERGESLKALFATTSEDHGSFSSMTIVPEQEFGLIAPIAAYLADDGSDPDDVPVGHCRAYAFKSCVAGTLGFPPNALEPRLPGIPRDVEAHFYLDAERLVFGTDDPEFVVLVNDYVKDQTFEKTTAAAALFEVLEFIVDDGLTYLSLEEDRLEHLEDNMAEDVTEIPRDFDLYIAHERRSLGELYNFYRQYADLAKTLSNTRSTIIGPDDRSLFSVLSDSAHHMAQDTQNLRDFALQIRGLFQSKIDERQNKVMSLLTVVTTIFMPLTLITGWFGMNFDVMPELHWEGSYYVVIAISFAIVTGEVIFFKHKKWF